MLTVTDNDGLSHSSRVEVTAYRSNMPPTAYISIYPNPAAEGEEITFEGYGDDEDGEVVEYRWTFPDERTFLDFGSSSYFTLESGEVQAGWYSFAVRDDNGAWSDEARVELELETLPAIPWMWIVTAMVLVIAVPLLIRLKKHSHPKIEIEIRGAEEISRIIDDPEDFSEAREWLIKSGLTEIKKIRYEFKAESRVGVKNASLILRDDTIKSISFGSFIASITLYLLKGGYAVKISSIERSLSLPGPINLELLQSTPENSR